MGGPRSRARRHRDGAAHSRAADGHCPLRRAHRPDAGPGNAPEIEITFPDGAVLSSSDDGVHAKLSDLAGREMRLTALPPADDTSLHKLSRDERENMSIAALRKDFGITEGEKFPDMSMFRVTDLTTLARYSTPPGMFVDLAPVHVMTQTSLQTIGGELGGDDVDVRRFRPNVLLALNDPDDELPESQWTGGHLSLGGAVLEVTMPTIRCVVPSRAQPGFDVDRRITKAVAGRAGRCLGSYCWVDTGGSVSVGDEAALNGEQTSCASPTPPAARSGSRSAWQPRRWTGSRARASWRSRWRRRVPSRRAARRSCRRRSPGR